jgi:hypothetical protein
MVGEVLLPFRHFLLRLLQGGGGWDEERFRDLTVDGRSLEAGHCGRSAESNERIGCIRVEPGGIVGLWCIAGLVWGVGRGWCVYALRTKEVELGVEGVEGVDVVLAEVGDLVVKGGGREAHALVWGHGGGTRACHMTEDVDLVSATRCFLCPLHPPAAQARRPHEWRSTHPKATPTRPRPARAPRPPRSALRHPAPPAPPLHRERHPEGKEEERCPRRPLRHVREPQEPHRRPRGGGGARGGGGTTVWCTPPLPSLPLFSSSPSRGGRQVRQRHGGERRPRQVHRTSMCS